jgi:diamine N-acetyltransferase
VALGVRRWAPTDVPSVQHIAWTTWVATYGSFIPEPDLQVFFDEHYSATLLEPYCTDDVAGGFLAEMDDQPAGFAKTLLNREEGRFYLSSLYVLPEHQGRGIGARLLHAAESFATTLGAREVWLGVMMQNTAALDWYRRIGFRFVREEPFSMGQTTVSHLIGYRAITPATTTES